MPEVLSDCRLKEELLKLTASTSTAASMSQQLALDYSQALYKNATRDSKLHSLVLGDLVLPVTSREEPATASSTDKTDNHDLSFLMTADMRREDERFKSFEKWPVSFLQPAQLAANGFYYLGRGDEVRCAFCKVEIMHWEEGDDPASDHQRWAPQCPFLRQRAVGNVPLDGPQPSEADGHDECGVRAPNPIVRTTGPVHTEYACEAARVTSFRDWPRSLRQKPEELAEAGFFYTGQGDKTKCFYCDGGLKDWEDEDVPWEQHARWFHRCAFVRLVKGREYVQRVVTEAAAAAKAAEAEGAEETKAEPTKPEPAPPAPQQESPATEIEDNKLCKICFNDERNICFVPCGHVVACAKCALSTDKCPMCRQKFTDAVRLYYS